MLATWNCNMEAKTMRKNNAIGKATESSEFHEECCLSAENDNVNRWNLRQHQLSIVDVLINTEKEIRRHIHKYRKSESTTRWSICKWGWAVSTSYHYDTLSHKKLTDSLPQKIQTNKSAKSAQLKKEWRWIKCLGMGKNKDASPSRMDKRHGRYLIPPIMWYCTLLSPPCTVRYHT